jgi:hypothetical protein
MSTYFKTPKIVSKKIRESAKGEMCSLRISGVCNHNSSTTVLAHLNTKFKGTGNKSPDIFAVYACQNCHTALDSNAPYISAEDKLRALIETQMKFVQKRLMEVK